MLKDNLIILRNIKGLSQEDIAEKIGISRQAYGKWEKGETIPDINKCALLAEFYGTTIDDLVNFKRKELGINLAPAPKGKHIFGTVIINEKGQIVIPKIARETLDFNSGDRLIVLGDEKEGLALVKATLFEERMKNILMKAKDINK